jgi:signal transduction histidine kinase
MDLKNIVLYTLSVITTYLCLFILRSKKSYSNTVFAMFIFSVGIWSFGVALFDITDSLVLAETFARSYYVAALSIPLFFLLFSFSFPKNSSFLKSVQYISSSIFIAISVLIFTLPTFIFTDVSLDITKNVDIDTNSYSIYFAYFVILIVASFIKLYRSFKYEKDLEIKRQLEIILLGTIIPFLGGMFFNLILPIYTYQYIWTGPMFGMLLVLVVFYAVYKHKLFDAKVITSELFTFSLWVFILIRVLVSRELNEVLINFGLLTMTIVVGIFLIKSVKKEVETREKIQTLAEDLEKTNIRLRELDQQKSEFVSLASHQLRGPLTAVKGYASMLLEGDFGEVKDGVKDAMEKIYTSTQDLVVLVNDYLDVSRIEQGRMQYDFSKFDIQQLVATIITELQPNIDLAGNKLTFDYENGKNYMVNGDQGKIKQVISNLLDNSNKYTPKGEIHVWVRNTGDGKIQISISDNGVGIHPDVLPQLFEKFTRAPDASKTNILGTGLGLYVAKKMIEANHGRVWAESAGQGKGSTFFIEIGEYKQ